MCNFGISTYMLLRIGIGKPVLFESRFVDFYL